MEDKRKIDFEINEELRSRAIAEYIEKTSASRDRAQKRVIAKAYKIIIIIMLVAVLAGLLVPAMIMLSTGRGIELNGFVLVFTLAILFITAVLTVILVNHSASNNMKNMIDDMTKDLAMTTYRIEDGYLIREYKGDKRKTKKYDLSKIYYPDKEGDVVSFEYKRHTVELIDFYEPSMYETLKAIKEQGQED